MADRPAPGKRLPPTPGKRLAPPIPEGMMMYEGRLIPQEGAESVGFGQSPIDWLAFGIAGTILGGLAGGAASIGADIAGTVGAEALPEDTTWWLKIAVPFGAAMLGGAGMGRLLAGKTMKEAVPIVREALEANPKAVLQLPEGPPSPKQLPAAGESTFAGGFRREINPQGRTLTIPEPVTPVPPRSPLQLPGIGGTTEGLGGFNWQRNAAGDLMRTGPGSPIAVPRPLGGFRAAPFEPPPAPVPTPGAILGAPPSPVVTRPHLPEAVVGPSFSPSGRFTRPAVTPPSGAGARDELLGARPGGSLLERLAEAKASRPRSAAGTQEIFPPTKSGKSYLGAIKAQASREASRGQYAKRLGLEQPPSGGGSIPPSTAQAASVPEFGVPGGSNPWGYLGSTVLSRLERIGGETGHTLRALEGQASHHERKWLADYIQPLVDKLGGLSKAEAKSFIATADQGVPPINRRVADAVTHYSQVFGEKGQAVRAQQEVGLPIEPIKGNYWMHVMDPANVKKILADPQRFSQAAAQLKKSGRAMNDSEARYLLQKYVTGKTIGKDRPTGAEFERAGIPGWIDDPARAVLMRGSAISKRIAERKIYGENDINIRNLIHQGGFDPETAAKLNQLMELTIRRDPIEMGVKALTQKLMSFNAITGLSLSGIVNLSQNALLSLRTSFPNMVKAHLKFLAHPVKSYEAARQLGVYADIAQKRMYAELTGGAVGRIGTESLRFFSFTEKLVRGIADEAGKDWAKTIDKALLNPKSLPWVQKELKRLNFLPDQIKRIIQEGVLSPSDVELVRSSLVDQVAYLPRNARKSEFYLTTSVGPALMQFKSFLLNTGRLLKQTIADEYKVGNYKPIMRLLYVLPFLAVAGEGPADVAAAARGSRRPYPITGDPVDLAARGMENISQLGALGLGFEVIRGALNAKQYGQGLGELLGGPSLSLATEFGPKLGGIGAAALRGDVPELQRNVYELGRSGARRIPYFGPAIANLGMPSSGRPPDFADEDTFDRIGWSTRSANLAQLRQLMREIEHLRQQQR